MPLWGLWHYPAYYWPYCAALRLSLSRLSLGLNNTVSRGSHWLPLVVSQIDVKLKFPLPIPLASVSVFNLFLSIFHCDNKHKLGYQESRSPSYDMVTFSFSADTNRHETCIDVRKTFSISYIIVRLTYFILFALSCHLNSVRWGGVQIELKLGTNNKSAEGFLAHLTLHMESEYRSQNTKLGYAMAWLNRSHIH